MAKQTNGGARQTRTLITVHSPKGKSAYKENSYCVIYDNKNSSQCLQTQTAVLAATLEFKMSLGDFFFGLGPLTLN